MIAIIGRIRKSELRTNSNQGDCSIPSPSNTDFEDQAHAVACHYLFGHFNGGWTSTYSQDAADPWLGSYARGSDGELRPFLASTVGGIGGGLHGGGMFIPETMVPELLEELNDGGDAIIEDTNNYVTYTFSYSTDDDGLTNIFDEEYLDDCHDGDVTLNYEISDNDGEEVNY